MIRNLMFLLILAAPVLHANTHFLLMGSPGSGKGTLTQFLKENGDYEHLCLGDLLRREIALGTPLGIIFDNYVKSGDLVPNELLFPFFESCFSDALAANKKLIVDGMVQSKANVEFFDSLLEKYGLENEFNYVYLNIDRNTALERLLGRLVCEDCGRIYQASNMSFCEQCNGQLVKRIDDQNETILKRIKRFFESTIYLIDHYRSRSCFFEFDGNLDLDELLNQYFQLFLEQS